MIGLKDDERLVYAGQTALRAPNGALLPAVPQYRIVPAEEADPACVVDLKDDERLVMVGTIHNDKKAAEERFAALKKGRECPPLAHGIPLYVKERAENINPKTHLSAGEEQACEPLIKDLVSAFAAHMREVKALERQGKKVRRDGNP